jgi:hypothetical protein
MASMVICASFFMAEFLLSFFVLLVLPRTHYYGGRRPADERSQKRNTTGFENERIAAIFCKWPSNMREDDMQEDKKR